MDKQTMYDIQTVAELDTWANLNGLSAVTDTELNLRRLSLIAEQLTTDNNIKVVKGNKCEVCDKVFKQRSHLLRHRRTFHGNSSTFVCSLCKSTFNRKDNYERHLKSHKENVPPSEDNNRKRKADYNIDENISLKLPRISTNDTFLNEGKCNWCMKIKSLIPGKKFCEQCGKQGRECKWCHRPLPERFYGDRTDVCDRCLKRRETWTNRQQRGGGIEALDGTAQTETLDPNPGNLWDVLQFFSDNQMQIKDILDERLGKITGMKWFLTLFVKFVKYDQNNEPIYAEPTFRSINLACTNMSQLKEQLAQAFQNLHNAYQNFERDGSGWTIDKILKLEVNTVEYTPLSGSSYIELPAKIQKKKAVLNIQNKVQKCFLWSVLADMHPVSYTDHPDRVTNYKQYEHELDVSGIDFPVPLSQVSKFEKQNSISVNVFGLEGEGVYPLHVTDLRNTTKHVNLLLFSKGESRHYCLVRNLSRLLGDRTAHDGRTYYCNYCLHGYTTKAFLNDHVPYCSPHGPQKLSFPKKEEQQLVKFNQIHKQLKVPFVIYADFESFVRPISSCEPDQNKSSTTPYQKHEPSGFSYMVKCSSDKLSKPAQVYRGPDVVDNFFKQLIQEEENICNILENVKPMELTQEEEASFQNAVTCHICRKDLGEDRVRDHDHLNGEFRGASHSNCNFQYQFKQGKRSQGSKFYIPVVFHNLRGYDMHLLMESAGKFKSKPLSCIPNNMEKYMSFSLGNLRFIDSLQFLNAPLDTLVSNLAVEGIDKFPNLSKHFPKEHLKLLLRKGVYPYDYATSQEKFDESKLPEQYQFYNKLSETNLSDADYTHAQTVWHTFNMTCCGDYHDLYLKTDVLLLADVFENFRSISLDYYHLDPAHYYSAPGFSWEAMLKMTGVELQLLDDIDMVLMVEKGIRGGVSMISKKFAQANNPKAPDYDPSKPNTWLTYLDMNNLYGTSMSECLPEKDFAWLTSEQIAQFDVSKIDDDAETGYILEVDLEYPEHLHDLHSDYPLAPENIDIAKDMLSPDSRKLREKLKIKGKPSRKLVPNLCSKQQYVLHYRNLKYYLSKGMVLTKVHRGIEFTQSAWLKPYIDFNTTKRMLAKNDFEKDFFKLMNNSVFGKTMENMRKRVSVELVNTPKRLRKVCAKPNFQSFKIFNENLVAVNMKKTNIVLNRPIYAGFCILEISKIFMYQFHYDFIKQKYGAKAELLFTDTDSLAYCIETPDWYSDMYDNADLFDTSNYPKDSPIFSMKNCKVLGKMKDECKGQIMDQFVGLKPKMYSLTCGGVEKRTAKGVKKSVIEKQLRHQAYLHCLTEQCSCKHKMNLIRSFDHQLYSITVNKTSLCPYDDKRHFTGIESLAYGHYKISQQ